MSLLDRSQRRVRLTGAGRLLAARAERIELELNEAWRELATLSGRVSGPARIASFRTAIRSFLVPAIEILARTHPNLQPGLIELDGPPALKELRTGGVDLVIVEQDGGLAEPAYRDLTVRPLADDSYRVVVPATWPASLGMKELASRPWITGRPDTPSDQALGRLAKRQAFTPLRHHVAVEYPTVLTLVAAGLGAAIVPMLALGDEPTDRIRVTTIPNVGFRRLSALYRRSNKGPEPLALALIAALDEAVQAQGFSPVSGLK